MAIEGEAATRTGWRVIDMLILIFILAVALGISLPILRRAQMASHRQQCQDNLRQFAVGAAHYEAAWGVYPSGGYGSVDPATGEPTFGFSVFVPLLPFVEQQAVYNAVNFDMDPLHAANRTVARTGIPTFWCPADRTISTARRVTYPAPYASPAGWTQTYSSYGGIVGTSGLDLHPTDPNFALRRASLNGIIGPETNTRLASITDGTSTTMIFGEHLHEALPAGGTPDGRDDYHWWQSGHWNDALIETRYSVNGHAPAKIDPYRRAMNLGSAHPGGAQVAMADGSVHFLKDTINSWPISTSTGQPVGLMYDPLQRIYLVRPAKHGVLQMISTYAGGEVVPTGSY
jgi:prepilin-type processing-associated H-X9-DG protein